MKVLIALDDSAVSSRAAREATRLFDGPGTEFFVINVATLTVPWIAGAPYGVIAPIRIDPRWNGPGFDADDADVELMERAETVGVPSPQIVTDVGDPVTLICRAADEHDVDVVVVGSHDKSALRRLFDPSIADGIVRDTYRPVLVVSGQPPSQR